MLPFKNKVLTYVLLIFAILIIGVLVYFAFFKSSSTMVLTWNGDFVSLDSSIKLADKDVFSDAKLGELKYDSNSKTFLLEVYGANVVDQTSNLVSLQERIKTELKINDDQLCTLFIKVIDQNNDNLYFPTCLKIDQE